MAIIFFLSFLFFISLSRCTSEMYFNENYTGAITNGSMETPFNSLSQVFLNSFSDSIQLMLLSELHCNGSFVNDFGLAVTYIFQYFLFF